MNLLASRIFLRTWRSIQDFTTTKENTTTEDLPFFKEKTEFGDDAIALEKPGPEDSDTTEMDDE